MSMIDREKLIEDMNQWARDNFSLDDKFEYLLSGMEKALDIIESQPPADQWIPCSRELPKMNQPIIGTYENDGRRIVVVDNYFPQLLSGPWRLIAWTPAEPYKGE